MLRPSLWKVVFVINGGENLEALTPMMKQYLEIKDQYEDCILFFRLGDFYEMFLEDAKIASKELEITLTQRNSGSKDKTPMCGVPHHSSAGYITKLVERGYKVAICEQVEDPSEAKGIVRREVIKVITPGTITDINALNDKENNFLLSVYKDSFGVGFSYVDNSTGEMYTTELLGITERNNIIDEIGKIVPSEIICNDEFFNDKKLIKIIKNTMNPYISIYNQPKSLDEDRETVKNQFKSAYNFVDKEHATKSTSALLSYLYSTQKTSLDHINDITYYDSKNYMVLDYNTRANLEIHETIINRDRKGALIGFLDKTSTAMGSRLLNKWLEQPLINMNEIMYRNNIVEYFQANILKMDEIKDLLKSVYDIERLATKVSNGTCNGRDLISIKTSIGNIPEIKNILKSTGNDHILRLNESLDDLSDVFQLIDRSIVDNPPITIKEGNLIKSNYNKDLDELKNICEKGQQWLMDLELSEKEKSGIRNLKIGYNKVLGYYFEITKSNIKLAPDHFIRRQTLANAERYFTEELKEMESKILGAEDKALDLEYKIFQEIRENLKKNIVRLQNASKIISSLDVLIAFSDIAYKNNFIRPELNTDGVIDIKDGRHPVVESNIENKIFVPNDTMLDLDSNMVQIITGPNMAGKSTYMRQVAIITLMAHIGCFVPASYANISIVDRIFTRIGAADNLAQGESTFMVEMNEVSNIIKTATKNSLIILDEVGRGTSTYDGLSIAWAVVEFIAENIKAKTLFATHYHELTDLENSVYSIKNLTILAEEKDDEIIFLRKIVEGSTNRSYGIEVAKLAGIDSRIIDRSKEILKEIESKNIVDIDLNNTCIKEKKDTGISEVKETKVEQINMLGHMDSEYIDKVSKIDINNMTARDAFNILYDIVEEARGLKEN